MHCLVRIGKSFYPFFFSQQIEPVAAEVPWMTGVGNHEASSDLGLNFLGPNFKFSGLSYLYAAPNTPCDVLLLGAHAY